MKKNEELDAKDKDRDRNLKFVEKDYSGIENADEQKKN